MPNIQFKAKPETIYNMDDSVAYIRVKVPAINRQHCDMHAFRTHKRFGGFANSDMFPGMIKRSLQNAGVGSYIRLDDIPKCTRIDESGFLAKVTITIDK